MSSEFVQLSLAPMLIGTLASVTCALVGNFLVLRRQSLIGDAVAHVALPGIVVAFLITGTVAAGPMLIAMDGLRTFDEVMTMVRRLAIAGGLLAA
ncbi:MAG: metal ABC transporter permease, partial [Hyphomicrobium sp.]|nr:metal ABC transporter permease [Hyphomicrobium sp.]